MSSFVSTNSDAASLILVFLQSNLPTDLLFYSNISLRWLNYYRCSREEELDEKTAVSRISRAIRFRS